MFKKKNVNSNSIWYRKFCHCIWNIYTEVLAWSSGELPNYDIHMHIYSTWHAWFVFISYTILCGLVDFLRLGMYAFFWGGLNNSKKSHKYLIQANQNLDLLLVPLEARNLPPALFHCHSHTVGVSQKESSPACMKIKS